MNAVKRLAQDYAVGLLLVALFVYLSFASPQFLRPTNLGNVLEQTSLIGIIAMGVAVLMVSGNFDLSVGANVALSGICAAYALNAAGLGAAIVVGLGVSLLVGAINAILVVALGINSFMATLGMSAVLFGGALLVSSAAPVIIRTDALEDVVGARPLGIALPVWVFAAVVILAAWYLHFTVGGRETFAVGGNIEAARYGGVRTKLIRTIPFLLTGICCGISSLLLLGQINVALPDAAAAWALQVITAVVLGGVSIYGGRGTIGMALIGVLLIGVANNGFNLLGLPGALQQVFIGVILIVAVGFDSGLRALRARTELRRSIAGAVAEPPDGPASASASPNPTQETVGSK